MPRSCSTSVAPSAHSLKRRRLGAVGQPRGHSAQPLDRLGRRDDAADEIDEDLGPRRAAEDAGLAREPSGRLGLEQQPTLGSLQRPGEHPLGVGAEGGPHLVLPQVASGHERRARVAAEGRELRLETPHRLLGQIAAHAEERQQRLVLGRGRRGDDVALAQHHTALGVGRREAHRARGPLHHGARQHAGRVARHEDRREAGVGHRGGARPERAGGGRGRPGRGRRGRTRGARPRAGAAASGRRGPWARSLPRWTARSPSGPSWCLRA